MIVNGMHVFYIPLLGGNALRNITTFLANSVFIRLVKLGKCRLA